MAKKFNLGDSKIAFQKPNCQVMFPTVKLLAPTYCPKHMIISAGRGIGSSTYADNRRRRARKGPDPLYVVPPFDRGGGMHWWGTMKEHGAVVPSSRRGLQYSRVVKEEVRAA